MKVALNRGLRNGHAGRKMTLWDWMFLPAFISLIATLLLATSIQPFGQYLPEPVFPFVLAFTWPLIRPSLIAPIVLGGLGLFLDLFWGASLGLWALSLTLVYGVMLLVRAFVAAQEWQIVFGVYIAALLAMMTVMIIFTTLDTGTVPRIWGAVEQILATCLCFPAVLYLIDRYVNADVRFQ